MEEALKILEPLSYLVFIALVILVFVIIPRQERKKRG